MQLTFGPIVEMEPIVPSGPHPSDIVECSDGSLLERCNIFEDCRGNPHSSESDRDEADLTIVQGILDAHDEWISEYCGEGGDYIDSYYDMILDTSHEWEHYVKEWILDNHQHGRQYGRFTDCMKQLVNAIIDDLSDTLDGEWKYDPSDYSSYSGPGCYLCGFDIGEYEDQLDISYFPEFERLYQEHRLADILEETGHVGSSSIRRIRERDERWGLPTFETYHYPGGQWHFVVSDERMEQALINGIIAICRK